MADKNTNPRGGRNAAYGVMHNPDASRAHTRTRVVSPTGILKESLIVLPGARAHERVRRTLGNKCAEVAQAYLNHKNWKDMHIPRSSFLYALNQTKKGTNQ